MRLLWSFLAVTALTSSALAQTTLYQTSFEDPPFVDTQPVPPNESWANGSGTGGSHSVTTEQASSGSQSVKWDNATLVSFYSIRRVLNWLPTDPDKLVVKAKIYVTAGTGADRLYGVYLTGSDTGTLGSTILGVTIGGDGKIRVGTTWSATYSSSSWLAQAPPGTYENRWLEVEMTHDRDSGQAMIKVSGFADAAVYSANLTQATVPRNINIGTDYVTTTARTGVGYVDDLDISAQPGVPFDGWDETTNGGGDAGDMPESAQVITQPDQTPCESPITRIRGDNAADDVDMYVVCITDPSAFVASTVGGAGFDTQLWLFKCDGTGVVFNDDSAGGVQSRIDNSSNCIPGPGNYLLAISRYNRDAVDSSNNLIWNNSPFTDVRCADGPGAANGIAGWTGTTSAGGRYVISLQGAYFVSTSGCETCQPHNGDVDESGCVDDADLLAVLFAFGQTGEELGRVDANCDQTVDDADLLIVLFAFGSGC